jgi:two-component system phosphate regulon response regulator OmpR
MEEKKRKVLIVDDDARLRALLERYLGEQGFSVKAVADGAQMDRALARELYDLMVLDLMLPGEDGLAICRRLRAQGNEMPVVMLTAKGDEVDRIVGLEMGADDYLPKPFNPRELVARINAVLRRQAPKPPPGAPALDERVVRFGQVEVNLAART